MPPVPDPRACWGRFQPSRGETVRLGAGRCSRGLLSFSVFRRTLSRCGPPLEYALIRSIFSNRRAHRCNRALAALFLFFAPTLSAQSRGLHAPAGEFSVGSEIEQLLRYTQLSGGVEPYPWSIRGFSPREVERLLPGEPAGPWIDRLRTIPDSLGAVEVGLIAPKVGFVFNSAFPFGSNDGAVWAGRGITTSFQAGFAARVGPLSLTAAPIVFRAENRPFPRSGRGDVEESFLDPRAVEYQNRYQSYVDLPERFGPEAYTRIDPGQTGIRLDLPFVAVGASSANQHWGPAAEYAIVLGNNGPGFVHAFLGTSTPANVGVGKLHARMVWGRLEQSAYSPAFARYGRRLMSGYVVVFSPRGLEGLEMGAARFFHSPWPAGGLRLRDLGRPLDAIFKGGLPESEPGVDNRSDFDNQLASAFARWVFPAAGLEIFGEYGREDHNWNLRDLLLQPDHQRAYTLGLRKLWEGADASLTGLRTELLNARPSSVARVRRQSPFYLHEDMKQGHTQRGQILGSPAAFGGGGAMVAIDRYTPAGRVSLRLERELRQQGTAQNSDVVYGVTAEALRFFGGWEVTGGLGTVYDINRYLRSDVFNLNATLRVRVGL